MSKYIRIAIIAGFTVGSILLGLLMAVSRNAVVFEKYFQPILVANTIVTLFLLALVIVLLVGFFKRALKKKYGFKILAKLSLTLVISGILPGFLIFIVSVELLYGSVDSWSDVTVERALDSGLTLGREVLESYQKSATEKAKALAADIAETPPVQWVSKLHELSEREGYSEAMLVTSRGRLLGVTASSFNSLVPAVPSPRILQTVRRDGIWEGLEEDEGGITAKAVVVLPTVELPNPLVNSGAINHEATSNGSFSLTSPDIGGTTDAVYLSVAEKIPPSLASNSEILMDGYRGYQEMVLARSGLRSIYIATLSLVLLLSMFVAAMVSLFLADQFSKPLRLLLEGTRKVGSGRYEMLPVESKKTRDEVDELTDAFNVMTRKLAEAQQDIERRRQLLQQANDYLERILTKMSSGVIVADQDLRLVSVNPSASRILNKDLTLNLGQPMEMAVPEFLHILKEKIQRMKKDNLELVEQNEILLPGKIPKRITIFIRGTEMLFGGQTGMLFVFDDVSSIVAGQRAEAWTEVARRLAHEIKDPLTPIQLAAERLQMKLTGKVTGQKEEDILQRATRTIVSQVAAMKQMVDDFRMYAKIGAPKFEKLDLSSFVDEVTNLYRAGGVRPHLALAPHLPLIEADENQLRQILHNLFSNSMEAALPDKPPEIYISTSAIVNPKTHAYTGVRLDFIDNGPGFSENILAHVFEPYMTTKSSGTGLGMAMIKKIIEEHGGEVTATNEIDANFDLIGARVTISFAQMARHQDAQKLI